PLAPCPPISTLFPYPTLFRSVLRIRLDPFGQRRRQLAQVGSNQLELVGSIAAFTHVAKDQGGHGPLVRNRRPGCAAIARSSTARSEEHTSELQSRENLVCRLL